MANQADVRSLERLSLFLHELMQFRIQLLKEIEALELELRRTTTWLNSDVVGYWSEEYTKAHRLFLEAERNLSRCMSYVRADEQRLCTEEKKRVLRVKLRRELCEQKLKVAKIATGQWESELTKNRARVERCRDMADSDLLVAIHQLRAQIEHLESYAGLKSAANLTSQLDSTSQLDLSTSPQTSSDGSDQAGPKLSESSEPSESTP